MINEKRSIELRAEVGAQRAEAEWSPGDDCKYAIVNTIDKYHLPLQTMCLLLLLTTRLGFHTLRNKCKVSYTMEFSE